MTNQEVFDRISSLLRLMNTEMEHLISTLEEIDKLEESLPDDWSDDYTKEQLKELEDISDYNEELCKILRRKL